MALRPLFCLFFSGRLRQVSLYFISEDVLGMGLRFRLYGTERMRRERMIGESIIGFASLSLDEPSTHWVILEPRSNLSVSVMLRKLTQAFR